MKSSVGSFIVLLGYVIVLFVLVRPGSQGPKFIGAIGSGTTSIIKAATGGGTWAGG